MQMTKHGIPIDIPGQRKKIGRITTSQTLHNDFNKFNKFATMVGKEGGFPVTVIVPTMHPEFKQLKLQGFKVLEIWDKRDIKEETA